jgi:diaminohydroxyphosphoribosylaminopyrimidine deaminase / 5-amino-6-(5-phosphoribosylamino)uracil reductase
MDHHLSSLDRTHLRRTLELARSAGDSVRPNPNVGAVITRDNEVVAEGCHARYGSAHAEAVALEQAAGAANGATLYCNLEPCSFTSPQKHQGPCTEKIIAAGISRVVIGQIDPNPHVRGRGIKRLQQEGIEVILDPQPDEAWYANASFNTFHALDRPSVTIKLAQSLDGRIASNSGDSKWISNSQARAEVHRLRASMDVILIGINTVLADDPRLTVRIDAAASVRSQPAAAVADAHARIPLDSYLVTHRAQELTVYTAESDRSGADDDHAVKQRIQQLEERGVRVVPIPYSAPQGLSVSHILKDMRDCGIQAVLSEGGAALASSLLTAGLYDRLILYIAPILIGGDGAGLGSLGVGRMTEALTLEHTAFRTLGDQLVFSGFRAGWLEEVTDQVGEVQDVHRID